MKRSQFIPTIAVLAALLALAPTGFASEFPKGSPTFKTNYDTALKAAKASGKPLVIVFSASWCAPCQANKKNVYPDAAVQPYHDKFVWAYLDADDRANVPAMQKYRVSGIPHIQFLDKDGNVLGQTAGGTTPAAFVNVLMAALKKAGN